MLNNVVRIGLFLFTAGSATTAIAFEPLVFLGDNNTSTSADFLTGDGAYLQEGVEAGDKAYFTGNDGFHGWEPWVTDGTPEGTHLVADVVPGPADSRPLYFTNANGTIYFFTRDAEVFNDWSLWKIAPDNSDVTLVKDLDTPFVMATTAVADELYFIARSPTTGLNRLWRSNGTHDGTYIISTWAMDNELVSTSDRAFFVSNGHSVGFGISAADPVTSSITPLAGISYPDSPIELFRMFPMGDEIYFSGRHEWNYQLLKSDGSPEGTTVVKKLALSGIPNPIVAQPSNGKMLFHSDINPHGNLWITDGTASGTVALGNYNPPFQVRKIPIESTALGSQIVFVGYDATNGYQPWITDGTASGTKLLKIIKAGGPAVPHNSLITADQYVYFRADDGVHGFELWRTDGTADGTVMVKDINPGLDPSMPSHITYANGYLVFSADDGINGNELWVIPPGETEPEMVQVAPNGTESNPRFLGIMPGPYELEAAWHVRAKFNVLNNRVVFQADHPDHGNDLWALPLEADSSVTDWNLY